MDGKLLFLALVIGILILAWVGAGVLWRAADMAEIVAPIDPYATRDLEVTALGTGGEYENPRRHGPSTAIGFGEEVVLVDVGRGVAEALRSAAIPLDQPRVVVLTSLLPVNTMGLDDLIFTSWLTPGRAPLRVLGPPGTRAFVEALATAYAPGGAALGEALALPKEGARVAGEDVEDGFVETLGGLRLEARALPGGPLPTLAWRFSDGDHRIVVSGAGWGRDVLASFAGGADVLVHEAAYLPTVEELEGTGNEVEDPERIRRERAFHTSLEDVGDLATDAQVDRLVLVRLRPPPLFELQYRSIVARDYEGEILLPEDGDVVFP
ncbi:MAG: hypothetical protein H6748_16455 [Spirochaetaceae bacterium]|nr:hypothetical protein [Myxococcales bacterium]MCB9725640.1 hypothetical protein [Spirochaetaceae bacterium]